LSYLKNLDKDRRLMNMFKSNSVELMNGYENIARSMMRNANLFG
jgi:hypothetical protein